VREFKFLFLLSILAPGVDPPLTEAVAEASEEESKEPCVSDCFDVGIFERYDWTSGLDWNAGGSVRPSALSTLTTSRPGLIVEVDDVRLWDVEPDKIFWACVDGWVGFLIGCWDAVIVVKEAEDVVIEWCTGAIEGSWTGFLLSFSWRSAGVMVEVEAADGLPKEDRWVSLSSRRWLEGVNRCESVGYVLLVSFQVAIVGKSVNTEIKMEQF
jgi:hypothetical protein